MSDELTAESLELARESGIDVQPHPQSNDLPSAHDLGRRWLNGHNDIGELSPEAEQRLRTVAALLEEVGAVLGKSASEELARRKEFGLRKYGSLLQPHNGRSHLADAFDEAADLFVYLLCAAYEEKPR